MMKTQKIKKLTKRQISIIATIAVFLLAGIAYDSYIGDNIRFYAKWVQCGQKPIGATSRDFLGKGVPHYVDQPLISGFRDMTGYFCTPVEAERAGYSADPDVYEMPHLDAKGEQWPKLY